MATLRHSLSEVLRRPLAVAIVLAVVLLAGVNWVQDPARAWRWVLGMLMLPGMVVALMLWYAWTRPSTRPAHDDPGRQRYFQAALTLMVLAVGIHQIVLLSLLIWARVGDHAADLDVERRILGLATAAVLLIFGNMLPKILTPLSMLPLRLAERVTRARRFVGTVWVVLGVAMAVAFIAAPVRLARSLETWLVITGVLTTLGAIVWMNAGPAGGEP